MVLRIVDRAHPASYSLIEAAKFEIQAEPDGAGPAKIVSRGARGDVWDTPLEPGMDYEIIVEGTLYGTLDGDTFSDRAEPHLPQAVNTAG